ncbi:MAG: EAL domain-containing protein [Anaerovoracaceae bacterium]
MIKENRDNCQMKTTESPLLESYKNLINQMNCSACLVNDDIDFTVIHGNSNFYKLLGYTREELAHKYQNHLSAIFQPKALDQIRRMDSQEGISMEDQKIRGKGGEAAWINTQISRIQLENRSVYCFISFGITGYKKELEQFIDHRDIIDIVTEKTGVEVFEYKLETKTVCIHASKEILNQVCQSELNNINDFSIKLIKLANPNFSSCITKAFEDAIVKGSAICNLKLKNGENNYDWYLFSLHTKENGDLKEKSIIGVFENIDQQKEAAISYLNETQFYQAMLSEKTAYAQLDLTEDKITRIGGLWNGYNQVIDTMGYSQIIKCAIDEVVHPEDCQSYMETANLENLINSFENGITKFSYQFRRISTQNKMAWMEAGLNLFKDHMTNHIIGLAYLNNIDKQKRRERDLLRESGRDTLTSIYSNKMAESLISGYLESTWSGDICAVVILEIDNLMDINKHYGYKAGDDLLVGISQILLQVFKKHDIIGRLGGNEFVLLLESIGSERSAKERFDVLFETIKLERGSEISCSVGVTMTRGSQSYEEALEQAHKALCEAKNNGGRNYAFYYETQFPEEESDQFPEEQLRSGTLLRSDLRRGALQENISFESFLAEQGDMAYLIDPENYKLICANKAFYDRLGISEEDCFNKTCYEVMQGRVSPCPFCGKVNWRPDKFYMWRHQNLILKQEFLVKEKLVQWNGKEVVIAIYVDISKEKSTIAALGSGNTKNHSILMGIQAMCQSKDLHSAIIGALETIATFFNADYVQFWSKTQGDSGYKAEFSWPESMADVEGYGKWEQQVSQWIYTRRWKQPVIVENPESMLSQSFDMYQFMKNNNINNLRWVKVEDEESTIGYIGIQNVSANYQNEDFLDAFSGFIASEIKKRQLIESTIYASTHDDLTGLLNRLRYRLYAKEYHEDDCESLGVVVANIDDLEGINNARGVATGDFYIKLFAEAVTKTFTDEKIFRLNGDEFLVIGENNSQANLEAKLKKTRKILDEYGKFTVSFGSAWDDVEKNLEDLTKQAMQTMQLNKKKQHEKTNDFDNVGRLKVFQDLIASIENRQFEIYLQPKINMREKKIIGAEALIRYNDKNVGIVSPVKFIPSLEENNLVRYVDLFVFEEVCRVLEKWKGKSFQLPTISLNFSRLTLVESGILEAMEAIIAKYDVAKGSIEIEITESLAEEGRSILYQAAKDLYEAGYAIGLDDFGIKYANLSILTDIKFDVIKLDKSLIHSLAKQKRNQVVLKNIVAMCNELEISVIAEGVETKMQEEILCKLGCDLAQGYLYGKPMPVNEFEHKFTIND